MATSPGNGAATGAADHVSTGRAEASVKPPAGMVPRADIEAVVTAAFEKLNGQIAETRRRATPTLEDLAKDLMRPVIKEWLDENLAPIVERLVQEEIERVTRRHGL